MASTSNEGTLEAVLDRLIGENTERVKYGNLRGTTLENVARNVFESIYPPQK